MNLKKTFLAFALVGILGNAQNQESYRKLQKLPIQTIQKQNGDVFLQADFTEILTGHKKKSKNFDDNLVAKDDHHFNEEIMLRYVNNPHPNVATIKKYILHAATEFNVPFELLDVIAKRYNNYNMIGPSMYDSWGIMGLVDSGMSNTLSEAARLINATKDEVKFDPRQNIRAAAALLSFHQATKTRNLTDYIGWFDAFKELTGSFDDEGKRFQAMGYYKVLNEGMNTSTLWRENAVFVGKKNQNLDIFIAQYETGLQERSVYIEENNTLQKGDNNVVLGAATGTVDFPSATAYFTDCNFNPSRGGVAIDTWVNHYIAVGTARGAADFFRQCRPPSSTSSAHFIVALDGTIYQSVKVTAKSFHAGASGTTNNERSIGTEHEVTTSTPSSWNNTTLLKRSTDLARFFINKFNIKRERALPGIRGHNELPGTSTLCPANLPWTTWMNLLNNDSVNNTPTTTSPANNATGVLRPVNVTWTTPVNATSFRLQVSKSNTGWTDTNGFTSASSPSSTVVVNASLNNVLNFFWQDDAAAGTFEGPKPNTTYYYTVRSFDATTGTSKYSSVKTFKTDEGVNLTSPAFGATVNAPVPLAWTSSIGTSGSYRLQIAKSSTGWTAANGFTSGTTTTTNVVVNHSASGMLSYSWAGGSAGSSGAPVAGTTYYWTVRLFNPANNYTSSYSPVRAFKVSSAAARIFSESTYDEKNILIYPNPSRDYINVAIRDNNESTTIEIIDFNGAIIKSIKSKEQEIVLDVNDVNEGIYILRTSNSKGSKVINLVIKK
jgi:hypothetical protein